MKKIIILGILVLGILFASCSTGSSPGNSVSESQAMAILLEVQQETSSALELEAEIASSRLPDLSMSSVSRSVAAAVAPSVPIVINGDSGGTLTATGSYSEPTYTGTYEYDDYSFTASTGESVVINGSEGVGFSITMGDDSSMIMVFTMSGDITMTIDGDSIPLSYDLDCTITISGEGDVQFDLSGTVNGIDASTLLVE